MEDEIELEMSPFCQDLTVDGKTVEVHIYRGDGSDWILEVVDEFGTSTVWDDHFVTDQGAFDELVTVIGNEGIDSLIDAPS